MTRSRLLTPVARALVALQALLILTGGAVRLTGSGLGCPTWPECTADSYTPVEGQIEGAFHAWIEFGNRLLTFILFFAAVAIVILVLRAARKDLRLLAFSQIGGIFGQAILGGITVLTKLNPLAVASHFLLSIILLAAALSLFHRIEHPRPTLKPDVRISIHTALTFIVLIIGTLVTGAGPHAGDISAPRLAISIHTIATIHGLLVVALIAYSVYLLTLPQFAQRWLYLFIAISLGQGVIGYVQYLLKVPQLLVAAHLGGSALVWIAAWQYRIYSSHYFSYNAKERE